MNFADKIIQTANRNNWEDLDIPTVKTKTLTELIRRKKTVIKQREREREREDTNRQSSGRLARRNILGDCILSGVSFTDHVPLIPATMSDYHNGRLYEIHRPQEYTTCKTQISSE